MTDERSPSIPPRGTDRRTRRLIVLIALIAVAPIVLAWGAYHYWPRNARTNYGELLTTAPMPRITGERIGGTSAAFDTDALRGRWLVLYASGGGCDSHCEQALYATRQARTLQNAERNRVLRIWLVTDSAQPSAQIAGEHPDLEIARVSPASVTKLPRGSAAIYLVDPLGNLVLAWPVEPDIKALAHDLSHLLRASQIG
ncbi:MAG: hypothetical protein JSS46_08170 [Proteobacteria bacterium]|nr:hypothetical protein [Pseudomonadota bacterium]